MFNLRSTELFGQCDQEKDDDLLKDLNTIYNQVLLNNDLNCVDLPDVSSESDELCHKSINRTVEKSSGQFVEKHEPTDSSTGEPCRENSDDHLNNSVQNVNNLKANELDHHQIDDENQYLFSNLKNDQLIFDCKDFISFANQNLHDFLLYDKDRINNRNDLGSSKRKSESKPKFCDNVNNGTILGCTSTTTNSSSNASSSSSNTVSSNCTSIKSSSVISTQTKSSSSNQQLNILNFKSLVFDRSKRKLLKLLLKLKEEEKNENNDLNGIQIRKDCQLLARYIKEEKLSHLQLKLYPNNQGYSISLKKIYDKNLNKHSTIASNIKVLETIKLPYDETELLDYIDNEQIPPMLLDVLDSNCDSDEHLDLFHFGKLFIEIQDFRKNANATNPNYESKFVLLKPSVQTILNDVEKLTNSPSMQNWSNDDKLELESKLVLATSDPICLDPNPLTFLSNNQLNYEKKWLNNNRIKNICRKSSQAYLNQVDKFSQLPAPKNLELFDFIKKKHSDKHVDIAKDKVKKSINDHMFIKEKLLPVPKSCLEDVGKSSKAIEVPNRINDSMTKLEEYVMEYTEPQRTYSTTSISIFYRQLDDTYYGQLNVEKNANKLLTNSLSSNQSNSSCLFKLGNKLLTKKYIEQFIEILSEHGRKCIKITTRKPGEAPRINYTRKLFNNSLANQNLQNQSNVNDSNSIPVKKIKVAPSNPDLNPVVNGSVVNLNYSNSSNEFNSNSLLNSPNQNISALSKNLSNAVSSNQSTNMNARCKGEMIQHPILSTNLMQQTMGNDSLSTQNIVIQNNSQMRPMVNNDPQSNVMSNVKNLNASINSNMGSLNNSMNSTKSSTPEIILPTKSPYAQMSILEKNSPINQIHLQPKPQQPQQSNNLIANNPILNNLITNNTISTNLVQNNFIQLNTKTAKNINISNGYINETIQVNHQQNAAQQQPHVNNANPTAYIESTNLSQNMNSNSNQNMDTNLNNANLNPITISPIATSQFNNLNRLNSGKNEIAVILTTNSLPNSNFISANSTHNAKNNSIIQISSSGQAGQTTSTTTSLPTGVNLSSLALSRGQNLRVHNLVSLANVQGTNQCIALPISLMMASPNSLHNSQANSQQNLNGNVVVGLQSKVADHHQPATNPHQNVVLINNIDHTSNQIAYQTAGQQFSIGGTMGSLNCRNQNIQHTGTNANLQSSNLHLTNHQSQGPIAIHLTAANSLEQTQQPTTAIQSIGSQQVLTLQKND